MINKYYTPTIQEFHVGFEYEGYRDEFCPEHNQEWIELEFGRWNNPRTNERLIELINNFKVRVKYLDEEDFKDLGIKITKIYTEELDAQLELDDYNLYEFNYDFDNNQLIIEHFYQSKMIAQTSYKERPDIYDSRTLFSGKIKNKSELKRLMYQLEILK